MSNHSAADEVVIDRSSSALLHEQVADTLRERMDSGEWPEHYRLRSEPELAQVLGVSRGTLRKALAALIREGRLVQVRGRGTFVTSQSIEPRITQKLTTLTEDLAAQGLTVRTDVLAQERIPAPGAVAALLDVPSGTSIMRLERLRSDERGPIAFLINYVRMAAAPGILKADFTRQSLFGFLEQRCGLEISHGRRTFNACPAPAHIAEMLGVPEGSALLYLEQITYLADGTPIEYSDVWIHSGRMQTSAILSRR